MSCNRLCVAKLTLWSEFWILPFYLRVRPRFSPLLQLSSFHWNAIFGISSQETQFFRCGQQCWWTMCLLGKSDKLLLLHRGSWEQPKALVAENSALWVFTSCLDLSLSKQNPGWKDCCISRFLEKSYLLLLHLIALFFFFVVNLDFFIKYHFSLVFQY